MGDVHQNQVINPRDPALRTTNVAQIPALEFGSYNNYCPSRDMGRLVYVSGQFPAGGEIAGLLKKKKKTSVIGI